MGKRRTDRPQMRRGGRFCCFCRHIDMFTFSLFCCSLPNASSVVLTMSVGSEGCQPVFQQIGRNLAVQQFAFLPDHGSRAGNLQFRHGVAKTAAA